MFDTLALALLDIEILFFCLNFALLEFEKRLDAKT